MAKKCSAGPMFNLMSQMSVYKTLVHLIAINLTPLKTIKLAFGADLLLELESVQRYVDRLLKRAQKDE